MQPTADEPTTTRVTEAEYRLLLLKQMGITDLPESDSLYTATNDELEKWVLALDLQLPIVRRLELEREDGPLTPNVIPIKQENHGEPS